MLAITVRSVLPRMERPLVRLSRLHLSISRENVAETRD
ncbi:MAG: hypothetical protein HLUCCO07_04495 [Rhodobacteraceae bacterium HLUCCO07]|nr:MAG: hypothetical protein HLUCCO07_04495 [Rhodobacteraceae bacterium HLUCCO07]